MTTTEIFLTNCAWSSREKEGNRSESSTILHISIFYGQLGTLIDGKDKVYVLVFCHSRNNLYPAGFFRSVGTEYVLMSAEKNNDADLKSC